MTPEDKKIWELISSSIKPLKKDKRVPKAKPEEGPRTHHASGPTLPAPGGFQAHEGMDRALCRKIKKGGIFIDGRIDLHGMTKKEAYQSLQRFLASAVERQSRLVIVITGKGRPATYSEQDSSPGKGILRASLIDWMRERETFPWVRSISMALPEHGGSGAWYLVLSSF